MSASQSAQLASRLLAPRCAPERIEGVTRGPQDAPGLGDTSLASKPLAVCELEPGALERPPGQVAGERLVEAIAGVLRVREQCAGVTELQRDPCTGATGGTVAIIPAVTAFLERWIGRELDAHDTGIPAAQAIIQQIA